MDNPFERIMGAFEQYKQKAPKGISSPQQSINQSFGVPPPQGEYHPQQDPVPRFNKRYPVDPNSGRRAEQADFGSAQAQLPSNPPVSMMGDVIGAFSPSVAQNNGVREAMRSQLTDRIQASQPDPMQQLQSRYRQPAQLGW